MINERSLHFDLNKDTIITKEDLIRLEAYGIHGGTVSFEKDHIDKTSDAFTEAVRSGQQVYGIHTGFGPHARFAQSEEDSVENLLTHLSAGTGQPAPVRVVRLTSLLRIITLTKGFSGISRSFLESLIEWFSKGFVPLVPETGSVGASGDLIPLAHILQAYRKRSGFVEWPSESEMPQPAVPKARDALAFVNGTAFSQAYLVYALSVAFRLLNHQNMLSAFLMLTLHANQTHFDERLHKAKGHSGQIRTAAFIRKYLEKWNHIQTESEILKPAFQEVYSLRCIAQVLGACLDQAEYSATACLNEINGIDDNPVIDLDDNSATVLHGGNFFGQHLAFAADALNAAALQAAQLAERQISCLLNPHTNGGFPGLSKNPGKDSGLSGVEISASSLLAEMRAGCNMHSTFSVPTNSGNQDIVPMATLACRKAFEQVNHYADMLSLLSLCLHKHIDLTGTEAFRELFRENVGIVTGRDSSHYENATQVKEKLLRPVYNSEDL